MGGSKERINKKKMERKSQQQERKQKGLKKCAGKFGKQKREKLKKSIKKEKTSKFKKNLARKLQGMSWWGSDCYAPRIIYISHVESRPLYLNEDEIFTEHMKKVHYTIIELYISD